MKPFNKVVFFKRKIDISDIKALPPHELNELLEKYVEKHD
jgi:hypothetical protein